MTMLLSRRLTLAVPVSAESFGAGSIGVRSTWPAMVRRAASMSERSMLTPAVSIVTGARVSC
jgi:hypothetical protein